MKRNNKTGWVRGGLMSCTGSGVTLWTVFKSWGGGVRGRGPFSGCHYLWTGRCSPLRGLSGWGGGGCSSSWASREKWSEGMCGWGQPVMLLSTSHWLSSGPITPRTLKWVLEKKM